MTITATIKATGQRVKVIGHDPRSHMYHIRDTEHRRSGWLPADDLTLDDPTARTVAEAREIAALETTKQVRAWMLNNSGLYHSDPAMITHRDKYGWYPAIFGTAQAVLDELAGIVERQAATNEQLRAELTKRDATPSDRRAHLASCGHPADEDGECGCSSWPERAPAESRTDCLSIGLPYHVYGTDSLCIWCGDPEITEVPMVCTMCGQPVSRSNGKWIHVTPPENCAAGRLGIDITARVYA